MMHDSTDAMDATVSEKPLAGSMAAAEKLSLTDSDQREKSRSIEEASHRADFDTLVELASSTGGLLTDDLRRQACVSPFLANCSWNLKLMHELGRATSIGFHARGDDTGSAKADKSHSLDRPTPSPRRGPGST